MGKKVVFYHSYSFTPCVSASNFQKDQLADCVLQIFVQKGLACLEVILINRHTQKEIFRIKKWENLYFQSKNIIFLIIHEWILYPSEVIHLSCVSHVLLVSTVHPSSLMIRITLCYWWKYVIIYYLCVFSSRGYTQDMSHIINSLSCIWCVKEISLSFKLFALCSACWCKWCLSKPSGGHLGTQQSSITSKSRDVRCYFCFFRSSWWSRSLVWKCFLHF